MTAIPVSGDDSSHPGRRVFAAPGGVDPLCGSVGDFSSSLWQAVYDYMPARSLFLMRGSTGADGLPVALKATDIPWQDFVSGRATALLPSESSGQAAGRSLFPADTVLAIPVSLPATKILYSLYLLGYSLDYPPSSSLVDWLQRTIECSEIGHFHSRGHLFTNRLLGLISSLSRDLADVSDPLDLMDILARTLTTSLEAVAGCISLESSELIEQALPSHIYFPPEKEAFLREVMAYGTTEDSPSGHRALPDVSPPGSEAVPFDMPLRHRGRDLGRIVIWIPPEVSQGFTLFLAEGGDFIEELSREVSLRVMNLSLLRRSERLVVERQKRLQELWILQETNNALRGTLEINAILKMILAGATIESGLGFNRAALFLLNERTGLLQGMLGVGPDSREDADRIWNTLKADSGQPLALQIELYAQTQPPSRFDALVKSVRLPLVGKEGLLARCIADKSHVNVAGVSGVTPLERSVFQRLSLDAFAAIPIVAKDRVFGIIVVDNRFDGKEITSEDVRLLAMFAGQAGLAIANAKEHRAHRRAAEELRIARDQLVQTERLAVLGEVAASLAHEIRNPLVTIGGFARRLSRKMPNGDPNSRYASVIASEVERLEAFLEEILLFGKDRAPRLSNLDLVKVLKDCVDLFAASFAESGIALVLEFADDLPGLSADAGQLKQVFINIFTNALDVMPHGGSLRVAAAVTDDAPSHVTITVADTGGGVDPEVLSSIFNPFFTTKSGGHGLGLSLTQRIVSAHGGKINVSNRPGEGLTFEVALPLDFGNIDTVPGPGMAAQTNGGGSSEDDTCHRR